MSGVSIKVQVDHIKMLIKRFDEDHAAAIKHFEETLAILRKECPHEKVCLDSSDPEESCMICEECGSVVRTKV